MTKDKALKLALEALETLMIERGSIYDQAITAIKEALANEALEKMAENARELGLDYEPTQEPVAWKYDVTYNQDGTVSVALPDGDELRIVLPNQQEPYCWTWDVWVSGGKWRAEYGWKKPERQVTNLQPLYTTPPQRKPLTDEEIETYRHMIDWTAHWSYINFARAIEAAHGIKE